MFVSKYDKVQKAEWLSDFKTSDMSEKWGRFGFLISTKNKIFIKQTRFDKKCKNNMIKWKH